MNSTRCLNNNAVGMCFGLVGKTLAYEKPAGICGMCYHVSSIPYLESTTTSALITVPFPSHFPSFQTACIVPVHVWTQPGVLDPLSQHRAAFS